MTSHTFFILSFFGLLTGVVAKLLDEKPSWGGNPGAMLLAVCGAIVGGTFAHALFGYGVDKILLTASLTIAGALVLLFFGKTIVKVTRNT